MVEQLAQARLKRPQSLHFVVVPRLMTGFWRRHMSRTCDGYFRFEAPDVWPLQSHYEPLLIFVCLPYVSHSPRLPERSKILDQLRRVMSKDGVQEIRGSRQRDILRELWNDARKICPL